MPKPIGRSVVPIPDRTHVGPTTYDAKDPGTKFPPIESLRPRDDVEDADHLIGPEERLRVAMARQ